MGHIRLSREADLLVVAPATRRSDRAHGGGARRRSRRDDAARLRQAGADRAGDERDDVGASGDPGQSGDPEGARRLQRRPRRRRTGLRRNRIRPHGRAGRNPRRDRARAGCRDRRLAGRRALVTSGPTREPIDPVRYISNHSSGKQGHAIAAALAALGAETVLVSGPTQEPTPAGVRLVPVETARQMLAASEAALPVDVAVMAAAVSDWRVESAAGQKLKKDGKRAAGAAPRREPGHPRDASLHARNDRPALVIGFAAETENVVANARSKSAAARAATGFSPTTCRPAPAPSAATATRSTWSTRTGSRTGRSMTKPRVAARLADRIASAGSARRRREPAID